MEMIDIEQGEVNLLKEICKIGCESFDDTLLQFASPKILGILFFNRMQGIAYYRLKRANVIDKVNREFRNSLLYAYEQNIERNKSFLKCVKYMSRILSKSNIRTAMLKGSWLCKKYPEGCRTSNDIDLLVAPEDVTNLGKILHTKGFKQGRIRNGLFVPATRKEIIESKVLRGETVPYIRKVDLPFMKYLEIDLNFSLDYKNGEDDSVKRMLEQIVTVEEQNFSIVTLSNEDFFIHLCMHLYKEETTLPWIKMHRDMSLYKYYDIYYMLFEMDRAQIDNIIERSKFLGVEKICACAILNTLDLFNFSSNNIRELMEDIIKECPEIRLDIVSPEDKKFYRYKTKNITDRFFMSDRISDLYEVT